MMLEGLWLAAAVALIILCLVYCGVGEYVGELISFLTTHPEIMEVESLRPICRRKCSSEGPFSTSMNIQGVHSILQWPLCTQMWQMCENNRSLRRWPYKVGRVTVTWYAPSGHRRLSFFLLHKTRTTTTWPREVKLSTVTLYRCGCWKQGFCVFHSFYLLIPRPPVRCSSSIAPLEGATPWKEGSKPKDFGVLLI